MIRNTTRNQKLGWVLFIAYLTLLVYFMFFAESFGRNPDLREYSYNLELFKEIRRFYKYRKQLGVEAFLLNIVGNVAAGDFRNCIPPVPLRHFYAISAWGCVGK